MAQEVAGSKPVSRPNSPFRSQTADPWSRTCNVEVVAADIDDSPDVKPDNGVRNADKTPVRVIRKSDRRKYRLGTPDCPHCARRDMVAVVARGNHTVTWRCSRCAWLRVQPVPTDSPDAV